MLKIDKILYKKIFSVPILFCFSICCLGFFNSDWYSLIFYHLLFLLLYSSNLVLIKKNWLLAFLIAFICLIIKTTIYIPKIYEGSNVFIGGENYKKSVFKEKLPEKIYDKLESDYKKAYPNSISGPDNSLFDISVSQLIKKNRETRSIENIDWKNKFQIPLGTFNNTKYNTYGEQQPSRDNLPFFIKYSFPKEYYNIETKFCWKGLAYLGTNLIKKKFDEINCISINDLSDNQNSSLDIWLLETGMTEALQAKILLPFKYKIKIILKKAVIIISSLLILLLLFQNIKIKKAMLFSFSFIFSFLSALYFYPNIINKFILFEGGNDGLLYVHFAHLISDYISRGDYISAFMGGEEAYDLMPFYRYIWVINYLLFDESPWMLFSILTFFPLIIFFIFKQLINKKWANYFLLFWFLLPLFEAFGFFHYYYVKLTLRGFAEPLSYLFFLCALSLIIMHSKNEKKIKIDNAFLIGFLLSLAIGLRANVLPACLILIIFFFIENLKNKNINNILFLFLGISLILVIPYHNYYFTGKFIPLTVAAYKDANMGVKPSEYLELFNSIITFNFNQTLWYKILNHVKGEIKFYEVWYHIAIFSCIHSLIYKKVPNIIKCISLAALSLIGLMFFYHVGGRYSYLAWTLSLMVLIYWMKNICIQYIMKKNSKLVS
ncbi:MAG: hypothetical protein CMP40_03235 [Rickettsiales bacterium]|nr:hypothetical protein [Rickettsiales bacterium]